MRDYRRYEKFMFLSLYGQPPSERIYMIFFSYHNPAVGHRHELESGNPWPAWAERLQEERGIKVTDHMGKGWTPRLQLVT